jgi:hypothetical protein
VLRSFAGRRLRLALLGVLIVFGAGACQVRTDVGVHVNEDGSGTVVVAITLDADAVAKAPNITDALKVDDLTRAGWTVTQDRPSDGSLVLQAVKPFADPAEADRIFSEVTGPAGPLRDFHLTHSRSFARTTTSFTGTVDLSGGLESFGDSELAQALDGKPLGEDVAAIEQRIGTTLDKVFQLRVAVQLPGDVESNAPVKDVSGAVWQPNLSDPVPQQLQARGRSWRVGTLVAVGVALAALLALVLLLVYRFAVRTRRRRRHRRSLSTSVP